jgi:hypothetical protein
MDVGRPGEGYAPPGGEAEKGKSKHFFPWRLAPIRTWGSVGYTYRRENLSGQQSRGQLFTATINGSSFIWRPWFALVSGGVGLSQDWQQANIRSSSRDLTGNGSLQVFPESRFPFEAHFDVSDSRMDNGLEAVSATYRNKRIGFSQSYRTPRGNANYRLGYDRSSQTGATIGEYRQQALQYSMSRYFGKQTLGISGNVNRNERDDTGETVALNTLDVRHSYTPDAEFSLDSQASLNDNRYNLVGGSTHSSFAQFNSYAYWRPEKKPLTANGGVRLYRISGDTSSLRVINLNGGATYRLNPRVSFSASANLNQTASGGKGTTSSNQALGANYQSVTIPLGAYRYYWYGSGTVSNRTGIDDGQHLSLAAGHGLSRGIETGPGSRLAITLSQGISSDLDTSTASARRLSNTAAVTWNRGRGSTSTLVRLSVSDSRSLKDKRDFMQMINFQATVNSMLSRRSSLTGDLTIQSARQSTIDTPSKGFVTSSSGSLSYTHARAFGVPRLRFTSRLTLYGQVALPVLSGPEEYETRSWENRFNYSIGRLRLRLTARAAQLGGRTNTSIVFNAIRSFGNK